MALDQQRNWTVAMAKNLDLVMRNSSKLKSSEDVGHSESALGSLSSLRPPSTPLYLPDEILILILEMVNVISSPREAQYTLSSCCQLSHQWYAAAVPLLYDCPILYGKNFDPFVRSICPSINARVRKSPLSSLVRVLDLSSLVHQGSRSMTARLLGRTKNSLEEFVAPQASFAINCFPALSKCARLRLLDLSLVSEAPPLVDLFKAIAPLENLAIYRLPRSAGFGIHYQPDVLLWPPRLEDVTLSGGIDAHFLHGVVSFPPSLRRLTIEHCPLVKGSAVVKFLATAVAPLNRLHSLTIRNMSRLGPNALDSTLLLLPRLQKLSVSVDYVSPVLFDEDPLAHHLSATLLSQLNELKVADRSTRTNHLRVLELSISGNTGIEEKISPLDLLIALDEGVLPNLRQVRVQKGLMWDAATTGTYTEALVDALHEASRRDWESDTGAFASPGDKLVEATQRIWEEVAGVWTFDT